MNINIIYSIIIGTLSGIIGGAFGLGGSFIMLPGLILLNVTKNFNTAVGTVLFSLLPPVSLLAVIDYYKRGQVDMTVGTILFVTYFLAAYIGAKINNMYDQKTLEYACATVFLLITIYFYYHAYSLPIKESFVRGHFNKIN
jgi:uncharacterized membrane protein YfcA